MLIRSNTASDLTADMLTQHAAITFSPRLCESGVLAVSQLVAQNTFIVILCNKVESCLRIVGWVGCHLSVHYWMTLDLYV